MRVLLVPVANRPECSHALAASFRIAAHCNANVIGCHIRPHRDSAVRMPLLSSAEELQWAAAHRGKDAAKLSRNAETLFVQAADKAGFRVARRPAAGGANTAIWYERVGSPERLMPIVGPTSDLLVVSRPARKGGSLAGLFLMQALLNSCRPVLVLPQRRLREPGRHILLAWNQSPEASRAVAAGMSLLERADAVTIAVAGQETAPGPKAIHLVGYLRHHGIQADILRSPGDDPAAELEQSFREARADLLLMGAYSRSRLRERIFGGVTDHMLRQSQLPVMVYHSAS